MKLPADDIPPAPAVEAPKKKELYVDALKYAHIGFILPLAVIAGWLFGALLDKWLGTHSLYLVGLFLGIVAGFYDLIRTVMKMNKEG